MLVPKQTDMNMKNTILASLAFGLALAAQAGEPDLAAVEKQFRELPMTARRLTGPLFWMHGDETKAQLEGELQKVLEGGNGIFTTEPRPHRDWLGEGWYRDLDICLQFARKNDLQLIIYDDWWWPSQMMGGRVPPQYGSKRLDAAAVTVEGPQSLRETGFSRSNLVAVVAGRVVGGGAIDGGSLVNLSAAIRGGTLEWEVPAGQWKLMTFTWSFNGTKGGQQQYISVDGASPDCVDWFIQAVYQPHYDRFQADFGKTIVGFFYDEPETQGDWGSDLPRLIAERGLDLPKLLAGYKYKLAGEEQTAAYHTYLDLFAESWGRTMYGGLSKWCREHRVFSMGHFMEHDNDLFSRVMSGGNMLQLLKYSDMGGMDLVCGQLPPGQRPMGIYQIPKIASSISHVYHKADDIAFCEIYGGYNQDLTYPQMKWLADWHQVRGVNLLIPHSFNPRAPYDTDYPPYFYNGGFEPRWPLYRVWADYTSRLSLMLTGGRHICPVAFLHLGQSIHTGQAIRPEEFTSTLQDALYDCDWLPYDAFEDSARLAGREVVLHQEAYQVLVVPPVEVIPYATLEKAGKFFEQGGVVVGYGFLPRKSATLGRSAADIAALRTRIWGPDPAPGTQACQRHASGGRSYFLPEKPTAADIAKVLAGDAGIPPVLELVEGETGNWLHVLHRQKCGRDIFLICNQHLAGAARPFTFRTAVAGTPEAWDAMRNDFSSVPSQRRGKNLEFSLTLEPGESVLVVFQDQARQLPPRSSAGVKPARESIVVIRDASLTDPVAQNPQPGPPRQNKLTRSSARADIFFGQASLPAGLDLAQSRVILELDGIKPEAAASITVNGVYAGGFIGQPFRLEVTRHLKPGNNSIKIAPFAPQTARLLVY